MRSTFFTFIILLTLQVTSDGESLQFIDSFPSKFLSSLEYRHIGPFRGGRSCAVAGVSDEPNLYYFGATGGGVWRTTDGGRSWENISDGYFGGSIGAISVAPSDKNVIYVGGGEKTVRGNVSHGYGVWKSVDAGKTWSQKGLLKSRHISRIRIHPDDPDIVYAAVMGNLYKGTEERGVYKSTDGGNSWRKVLFANEDAGAVDLILDPNNPRIIYASTWRIRRTPYSLISGGAGSKLWKSTDSGETWEEITKNLDLEDDTLGIIGITVSPANSDRLWAIVEAENGGVFRSDDAGDTWSKTNDKRDLRQRAWYYTRIYADSEDVDVVYVVNVSYHKSKDGGRTFTGYSAPHGDHHDLWIAPENPQRMIIGDDGGAQVTYDGGETWSTYHNQPTAQFYRVTTDDHFPYRIYAAQQDNSTVRIASRTSGATIDEDDWEPTAGCECGYLAPDPENNEIVYGGCYGGMIQRLNHETEQSRLINVWPDNPMGHGAKDWKYRFNWNFPLFFSQHNPKRLYAFSNHLHYSDNEGQEWHLMSADLTRNDTSKLGPSGGPITKDNTSVEYYCTLFSWAESPHEESVMYVGSDDGLVHLTRDGGESWENVTPDDMPEWIQINSMEADPHNPAGCYIAATMYKHGDFRPYLYKTNNYGESWTTIVDGIADEHFTRVIRADPNREGILYSGTESGMYISFNDGESWDTFQLNLPVVPITDLAMKDSSLVVATQGRSLWVLDDLTPLYFIRDRDLEEMDNINHLFPPTTAYRMPGREVDEPGSAGENRAGAVEVFFHLAEDPDSIPVSLAFYTAEDSLIREYSTKGEDEEKMKAKKGSNRFLWNMRSASAKKFEGMVFWWASLSGPLVLPGEYAVELIAGEDTLRENFTILVDPRAESTEEELAEQMEFIESINRKTTEAHEAIVDLRKIKARLADIKPRLSEASGEDSLTLVTLAEDIDSVLSEVEESLYQTRNRSPQDPLNFPIRLTNKLAHLNSLSSTGDYPPTAQAIAVRDMLVDRIDDELVKYKQVKEEWIPHFNELYREAELDVLGE